MKRIFLKLIFIIACISMNSVELSALPVFAKKYKTSCLTCHVSFAKRNAYGEAFRRNGYVLPMQVQSMIKEQQLKLGADAWKEMWPEGIWPSSIPNNLPLALYGGMMMQYNGESTKNIKFNSYMPSDFGALFAGNLSDNISFFGAWSTFFGLNRLFIRFNDILGTNNLVNLKVGRFDLGINDNYQINQKITIINPITQTFSANGQWSSKNYYTGAEINGLLNSRLNYNIGLVNSIRYDNIEAFDNFDTYGKIGYKLGGISLNGESDELDSNQSTSHEHNAFLIGAFGYLGKSVKSSKLINNFNRFGFDLKYTHGDLELLSGVVFGNDYNSDTTNRKLNSLCYFGEVNYNIYPWLLGVLRLEYAESKFENFEKESFANIIPNLTILIRQNLRLVIESFIQYQCEKEQNSLIIDGNNKEMFKNLKMLLVIAF